MKIRKAEKKDVKNIAEILMKESAKKPYQEEYTAKKAIAEINKLLKKELYVAEIENEIVGFISSSITSDDKTKVYINELWLKPQFQRKGIGKELVKFIEKFYAKKGCKKIRLISRKDSGAFKFYNKLKYKEYKKMVFMEKKI